MNRKQIEYLQNLQLFKNTLSQLGSIASARENIKKEAEANNLITLILKVTAEDDKETVESALELLYNGVLLNKQYIEMLEKRCEALEAKAIELFDVIVFSNLLKENWEED